MNLPVFGSWSESSPITRYYGSGTFHPGERGVIVVIPLRHATSVYFTCDRLEKTDGSLTTAINWTTTGSPCHIFLLSCFVLVASVSREAFTLSVALHSVYRCFKTVQFFSGQKGVYIPHGRASHSHLHIFCIRCLLAIEDAITIVKKRSTLSGTQFVQSLATQSSIFFGEVAARFCSTISRT